MQGILPIKEDFGFKIDGKQFHVGAWGDTSEGNYQVALVAEKSVGGGVYIGAGAQNTWEFVHLFDAALWKFQNPNADTDSLLQTFVNEANVKLATYTGNTGTTPTIPTDIVLALQWYIKYKLSFRTTDNKLVLG